MKRRGEVILYSVLALVMAGSSLIIFHKEPDRPKAAAPKTKIEGRHLNAVIDLEGRCDTKERLIFGYAYYVLQRFAEENSVTMDITAGRHRKDVLDSLRHGSVDMVVRPFSDRNVIDSAYISAPVDSELVFVLKHEDKPLHKFTSSWIKEYNEDESHLFEKGKFLSGRNTWQSSKLGYISPYDDMLKEAADTLGIDWRMLAAVMFNESHFHIEARSHRGAEGLMQMASSAQKAYDLDDPLDPRKSIQAAAKLFHDHTRRFRGFTDDALERQKLALASYNAGYGRVKDFITLARYRGMDPHSWDELVPFSSELRDSTILEIEDLELTSGVFVGVDETLDYVEKVVNTYERFCRISPEK